MTPVVYSIAECDETLVHLDFLFDTQSLKDENATMNYEIGLIA